jgi:serine/threonine protein kinase
MKQCPQCDTGYPDSHATCPTHGVLLNEIRDLKPGMLIHKTYRIVRKLGQGGMGTVYLARHIFMKELRALKFLSAEQSCDQTVTSRFLREVRTLRQLRHNNVVDCGDLEPAEDNSLFFPMEFVDGPDLRRFLDDAPQPFDVPLALTITRGIAEGLGAAHSKGMVHRDIKPENILMAREGGAWLPKIADFGIVAIKESSSVLTQTGDTLLTRTYAAPEQWRGTPAAEMDARTDLYALGGLLYLMLTGQTVFHAENYEGWAWHHQNTPPQPPSALRPDLANWQGLDALVLRLLAKEREDRPRDVAELVRLIDTCLIEMKEAEEHGCKEKGAEEWLRKGLELQEAAPADPREGGPINPYANPRTDLACQLQTTIPEYIKLVLAGTPPEVAAKNLEMTPEDQEMAHVAHFFFPNTLVTIEEQLRKREEMLSEAFRCLERGIKLDPRHPLLQYNIGNAYYCGRGVTQDYSQAYVWFRKSAEQGNADAEYCLGVLYDDGDGVAQDPAQAAIWLCKAAEGGNADAQVALGLAYETGHGVPQDEAQAAFWLRKARENPWADADAQ